MYNQYECYEINVHFHYYNHLSFSRDFTKILFLI